jgi:alpha-L-rhamnosidase
MNRRELLVVVGGLSALAAELIRRPLLAQAQAREPAIAAAPHAAWNAKAEALKPVLSETRQEPLNIVRAEPDPALVLRYRMAVDAPASELGRRTFRKGDSFILDFGGHRTGFFAFNLETSGREPDAPARLRLTFGEVPTDVAEPLYPYKGELSSAWLPDEVINVDYLPQQVRMPRRYAFRYVKVEVLDTSPEFQIRFENVHAIAITSAKAKVTAVGATPLLRRIDEVAIATLRDCMQTSFEDGPRRDQRLWVGDLRLQALTNYVTFKANDLVKRCLYLFAANAREDGLVAACVYEQPRPRYGAIHIVDYAALYNVSLADYLEATNDAATARELWPVAKRQLEILSKHLGADGLYVDPKNIWIFIDWSDKLHRGAAIQALLQYAYQRTYDLAKRIGVQSEVAGYPELIARMKRAARRAYYDGNQGVVRSGDDRQVSWASQAWMTIAEVLTPAEGARALKRALADPAAIKPVTPYLYHYVVEALIKSGAKREARTLLESYWGAMVEAGADTFWEIFDPANPLSSPYGDIHINSYCHAWSCTPSYLLRMTRW